MHLYSHTFRLGALLLISILASSFAAGQRLSLKASGDERTGYRVGIYDGPRLLAANTEEFSLQLFNLDLSTVADITHWTGAEWAGSDTSITLRRESYIPEFDANLSVTVTYSVVNANVVKKTIELFQPSMPGMHYILSETMRPAETPRRYVTFEHDAFPGGFVHEMFPSAGFVTADNIVVGMLTDAGYRNHFTRTTRRRFSGRGGGFVGMRRLPDPNLYSVATAAEQHDGEQYVRQTFGELYNLDAGTTRMLEPPTGFTKEGNADIVMENGALTITGHPGGRAGIEFIAPFRDQQIYTISFMCKGNTGVAVKLFRVKNGRKTIELENGVKYIDNFPAIDTAWTLFTGSIMLPYIEHDSVAMFIGTQSGRECTLRIRDLHFTEHRPQPEPYNVLPLGETIVKTSYVFAEPWVSHRQYMISSQSRLAEGMGFTGTLIEKMLYANFAMLTWITDVKDMTPFNVPNMNYMPDMYNRDSFFAAVSSYNKELNIALWEQWGRTQTPRGGIGTIITPLMGSVEAKDNEATIEWLIWAMLNKRRFGAELPQEKIAKAVRYVLDEFDADGDGKCEAHFSLSQVDIVDFKPKTDRLGVNQGMLAVVLRTIKELGFDISDAYIRKAEDEYRNFYDASRGHMLFDRKYPDIITHTDLEPEFFSLWLFDRPLLTDEMVARHLELMPVLNRHADAPHPELGTTAPICVRLIKDAPGWAYLSGDYQPFEKFGEENYSNGKSDGFYYNGGSWFRAEYCAYVTGMRHGWKPARALMENRVWAEISLHPGWPFSKEFIPTKWTSLDSWWQSTRGLCWNVFILMANEVAGMRTPEMDPDYRRRVR